MAGLALALKPHAMRPPHPHPTSPLELRSLAWLVAIASAAFAFILWPFLGAVLWAVFIAIVFDPVHRRVEQQVGHQRPSLAALLTLTLVVLIVILPLIFVGIAVVQETAAVVQKVRSGEIVFVAILGGVGHPVGAFIGAAIFEFVKLFAAAYLTGAWQMVLGFVLIAMVFLAPRGVVHLRLRLGPNLGEVSLMICIHRREALTRRDQLVAQRRLHRRQQRHRRGGARGPPQPPQRLHRRPQPPPHRHTAGSPHCTHHRVRPRRRLRLARAAEQRDQQELALQLLLLLTLRELGGVGGGRVVDHRLVAHAHGRAGCGVPFGG